MNECKLTSGIEGVCEPVLGGLEYRFWQGYVSEVESMDGTEITFLPGGYLRQFEGPKYAHSYSVQLVVESKRRKHFLHTFTVKLMTGTVEEDVKLQLLLGRKDLFFIVETNDREFVILGTTGMRGVAMSQNTGQLLVDNTSTEIVFTGRNRAEPLRFSVGDYEQTLDDIEIITNPEHGFVQIYRDYLAYGESVGAVLPSLEKQVEYNARMKIIVDSVGLENIAELWLPGGGGDFEMIRINIIHPGTRSLTKVGNPMYVEDSGINAQSITDYYDTGFNPNSHGGTKFAVNSASMFFCITNNHLKDSYCMGGRTTGSAGSQHGCRMLPRGAGDQYAISINNEVGDEVSGGVVLNSRGFHHGNRSGANDVQYRHNNVIKLDENACPATVRFNQTMPIGVWKIGSGNIQNFTQHRFSTFGFGASMTGVLAQKLNEALNTV